MGVLKWYTLSKADACRRLEVDPAQGLTNEEAKSRLGQYGPNKLASRSKTNVIKLFFRQFADVLVIVLLIAATVSLAIAKWQHGEISVEALLIYAIVLAIAVVGFLNEYKAERTVSALKKLVSFEARVRRDGRQMQVPVSELVPGDIVLLEEGQKIAADARILKANMLRMNEASLTGESSPQSKQSKLLEEDHLALGDQHNMIFSGTVVASGTGEALVVATGANAEIGKIAKLVSEVQDEQTPMQQKLDKLGKRIGQVVLIICLIAFLAIFFLDRGNTGDTLERLIFAFTVAVALAVAAIPEGLAFVVRISLAMGARRMARRNALVRRLSAVESLGSTDVVCTDKTGTLTRGEMTVRALWQQGEYFTVTGEGYNPIGFLLRGQQKIEMTDDIIRLMQVGALTNNAQFDGQKLAGDPTELSLLVAADKLGLDRQKLNTEYPRLREMPFSSERKMMATLHQDQKGYLIAAKGAPEVLLSKCTHILKDGEAIKFTGKLHHEVLAATHDMTSQALRVLAVAIRHDTAKPRQQEMEAQLTFVGLIGIMDPPRLEVKEVITRVQKEAGMRVIMITGDNIETAKAVAKEVGIEGEAINGIDLEGMSDGALGQRAKRIGIYARVNPEHKIRIVNALQLSGHQVAMTGDGVNDAPALKAANIGVAMGITGTDAAKEASDLILLDDQFKTIITAIEEGRGIFDNMRKFVNFLLSTNIAEVCVVLGGVLLHGNLVLTAAQILFVNIVTDGLPAVALGSDKVAPGAMKRRPFEFQQAIITRRVWWEIIAFGILMSVLILAHYSFALGRQGEMISSSIVFVSIIIFTFARLVEIRRSFRLPLFSNPWLTVSVVASLLIIIALLYVAPLAELFSLKPIDLLDWAIIPVAACFLVFIMRRLNPVLDRLAARAE